MISFQLFNLQLPNYNGSKSNLVFVNLSPLALLGEGGEAGIDKQLASFRIVAKHSGQYLEINSILRVPCA